MCLFLNFIVTMHSNTTDGNIDGDEIWLLQDLVPFREYRDGRDRRQIHIYTAHWYAGIVLHISA